jgi:hypothetical protein
MDAGFTEAGWIDWKLMWERAAQQGRREPTVDKGAKQ